MPETLCVHPPHEVTRAVSSGWANMAADGKINAATRAQQFVRDLSARGAGPDHQHGALGQPVWIAVSARVHLAHPGVRRHDGRNDGTLKWARRSNHIDRFDWPPRCV